MQPREKLKAWMDAHGYGNKTLAVAMGFSYEYIYKIIEGDKPVADSFKFRFIERFGIDEATIAFDMAANRETV